MNLDELKTHFVTANVQLKNVSVKVPFFYSLYAGIFWGEKHFW